MDDDVDDPQVEEAMLSGAWGTKWEIILVDPPFLTERLKAPNGWLVCRRGTEDAYRAGTSMCFVPRLPIFEPPGWGSS